MAGVPSEKQDAMHFHIRGVCNNCQHVELYRTPLPDILIAGDLCLDCGQPDMYGLDEDTLDVCHDCRPAYARRLMDRWRRGEFSGDFP